MTITDTAEHTLGQAALDDAGDAEAAAAALNDAFGFLAELEDHTTSCLAAYHEDLTEACELLRNVADALHDQKGQAA